MSQRHQKSQTSVIPEAREDRKREHRRLRQKVRQDLHVAVEEGDVEEVVLDRPHPTHGYREDHEMPTSNAVPPHQIAPSTGSSRSGSDVRTSVAAAPPSSTPPPTERPGSAV